MRNFFLQGKCSLTYIVMDKKSTRWRVRFCEWLRLANNMYNVKNQIWSDEPSCEKKIFHSLKLLNTITTTDLQVRQCNIEISNKGYAKRTHTKQKDWPRQNDFDAEEIVQQLKFIEIHTLLDYHWPT